MSAFSLQFQVGEKKPNQDQIFSVQLHSSIKASIHLFDPVQPNPGFISFPGLTQVI